MGIGKDTVINYLCKRKLIKLLILPMKTIFTMLVFSIALCYTTSSQAQVERVMYQYLFVKDSSNTLQFNIKDNFQIIPWHHENKVMIEANITLENGNMDLLGTLIREGRYNTFFDDKHVGSSILKYVQDTRLLLKNKGVMCNEIVKLKIYIPDIFEKVSETQYARISDSVLASKGGK